MPEQEMCESCRFWRALPIDKDGNREGECRRRAPRPFKELEPRGNKHRLVYWPVLLASEWCGDWQPVGRKNEGF